MFYQGYVIFVYFISVKFCLNTQKEVNDAHECNILTILIKFDFCCNKKVTKKKNCWINSWTKRLIIFVTKSVCQLLTAVDLC